MKPPALSLLLTLPILSLGLSAQIKLPKPGEVIGLRVAKIGSQPGPGKSGVVRQDINTCKSSLCALPQNFPNVIQTNGGAAYDPVRGGVWIAASCLIACVDPVSCKYICKIQNPPWGSSGPAPLSPCAKGCAGLAFHNAQNTLYMVDSRGFDLHRVQLGSSTNPAACAFKSEVCSIAANFPKNYYLGGLAIDQVRQLLFVGSYKIIGTPAQTHLYVTSLVSTTVTHWCAKLCDLQIPGVCPGSKAQFTKITGLAFDSCRSILYITDANTTSAYAFTLTGSGRNLSCKLTLIKCCSSVVNGRGFHGLAVMPSRARPQGRSCTKSPCGNCPQMVAGTRGDAALGNKNFALTLSNAPTNVTAAILGIGVGPCVSPGLNLGFCQNITITPKPPLIFGVKVLSGFTLCSGQAQLPLPVTLQSQFCGLTLSAQWVMECRTKAGVGHGVSNCLAFQVTSN